MFFQPLEQFNVYLIHNFYLFGFTNYTLTSFMLLILICFFLVFPLKYTPLIPTRWFSILEEIYNFLIKLFTQHTSNTHSLYYFPVIGVIFFTVLFSNLLGLMPYSFTLTSHIFMTLTMSLTIFLGTILISIYYNKLDYFKMFIPKGVEYAPLKYFLVFIEVASYIIRPFSLAIRLFANMLAGHTLLYILNTFLIYVVNKKIIMIFLIPFAIIFLVFILELAIAFIQAYVFTTLLVIYINDIYNVSH